MKYICMTIIAAVILGVALPARAGSNVEEGAAVSLAALAVTGLITEAATRSSLDVTVEMFRETEGGNEAFAVKNPPALYRSIHDSSNTLLTAAQASHLNSALEPRMEHINAIAASVKVRIDALKSIPVSGRHDQVNAVISDLENLNGKQVAAYAAWRTFQSSYEKAVQTGVFSTADREQLQSQLRELSDKLNFGDIRYSGSSVGYLMTGIRQDFQEQYVKRLKGAAQQATDTEIEEKYKASTEYKALTTANQDARAAADGLEQVTIMLGAIRETLKAEPDLNEKVGNRLSGMGITLTPEALSQLPTREDIRNALLATNGALIVAAATASKDALMTLNSGVATTVNTGPLANEMTQGILAQSEILDKITDPRNSKLWVPFNKAATTGRLGDHNAVVYMDNAATPVLKKATFDPSAFVKAHGMMYTRAFKTSAALFGAPGELPANTASASNVFTLKTREMTVDDAESVRRTVLLKSLLALTTQLKKVQDAAAGNQAAVNETKKIVAGVAQSLSTGSE